VLVLEGHVTGRKRMTHAAKKRNHSAPGLIRLKPKKRVFSKFCCVYDVQIQVEDEHFAIVQRLGGNDGENLRNITRVNKEVSLETKGATDESLLIVFLCFHSVYTASFVWVVTGQDDC